MAETQTQEQTAQTQATQEAGKEATATTVDLVTRVSQVKPETTAATTTEVKEPEFDFKNIELIQDPKAKEQALAAYKSFQKGFNQKFQEIAELRKSLEAQKQQPTSWTPERLQQEMNKPDFVQAAQSVIKIQNPDNSRLTDNAWSALTDDEKKEIMGLKQEVHSLKQQSFLNDLRARNMVEDEQLKTKYADYDPKAIDTITAEMLAGKFQATREHLYKAVKFNEAVRKAYELGKSDKQLENKEKITSMSATGTTVTGTDDVPPIEMGETSKQYFLRLASRRMKQASGQVK